MTPILSPRRVLGVLALAAGISWALPLAPAVACTCAVAPASAQLDSASFVFAGLVIGIVETGDLQEVTFDVRSVYKGDPPASARVRTPATPESCGIQFIEDASYLVFAQTGDAGYATSLCNGTTDDLTYLDRAGYPSRTVSLAEATAQHSALPASGRLPWLAGASFGVALVFVAHARRFRRIMR